jgi:ABC-type antimicrobial peptide transport system permease subunit
VSGVAVVSRHTADTLWPGEPAIGRAIWLPDVDSVQWREVVGVVDDIQFGAVGETPALHVFVPWTQDSASARVFVTVKLDGAVAPPLDRLRDLVKAAGTGAAVDQITPLSSLVERATAQPRFTSRIVLAFGLMALLLASVGIYGTMSYLVGQRTVEIGVRVALGASRRQVFANVIWRGLLPAALGGVAGLALAFGVARGFRSLLFGVEPLDAVSFTGGVAMLCLVALAAAMGPARRAAGIDPIRALRME